MAATLNSDGTFGILNIMLCGILYMNTIVKACLYISNQNWKTVLYVKQRQVDFSRKYNSTGATVHSEGYN